MRVFTKVIILFLLCFAAIQAEAQSVGGTTSGAATYCSSTNSGFISLLGHNGSILNWESSTNGGLTWTTSANTTPSESYFNLSQTTCYRAIVKDGAFPADTSSVSCVTVYQPTVAGSIAGGGIFCGTSGSGTLTLSGNTGNPLYWEYSTDNGLSWTTVANTTTTLNYSAIMQNTIYQAVVQNGSVCPTDTSSQVSFTIDSLSDAGTISGSDTVCYLNNAGSIDLTGITGTVQSWIFSTDNGITWTSLTNTTTVQNYSALIQETIFAAIVRNNSCPSDTSLPSIIDVYSPISVFAGTDTSINNGQSFLLNGSGSGSPLWTPSAGLSDPAIYNPVAMPLGSTIYTLTVTDSNSCSSSDNVTITVIMSEFDEMISNLFTPNGDGINDTWYIENITNYPGNEVTVYNIYGNKVYEKKEYTNDWNGTYNGSVLPDGTYYYILKFEGDQKAIKGAVDILSHK
jgi:gliding motility-associated-like protein